MSKLNRRNFLGLTAATVAAAGLTSVRRFTGSDAWAAEEALPAGAKEVPATDAVAVALGYYADATKVDVKKWKKKGEKGGKTQTCANCVFYTASNKTFGKCTMLASGLVRSKGWCNSWQKKA